MALELESLRKAIGAHKSRNETSHPPAMIDLLDWHVISPEFQTVINKGCEVMQSALRGQQD